MNGLDVMLPFGERFFARAARAALPGLADPVLIDQVKGFVAQEIHHAHQHERTFAALDAMGLGATELAKRLEYLFGHYVEPRLPHRYQLALVSAVEHFTATLAEFLFTSEMVSDAEPRMRALYVWHAAEEIEHKCVAFDLLRAVDDSYALRAAGIVLAFPLLMAFWYGAAITFVLRDGPVRPWKAAGEYLRALAGGRIPLLAMVTSVADYLRPGFHPSQHDNFFRARDLFGSAKAAPEEALPRT